MRSKLFIAFFAVIATALASNLIFERLIIGDFEEYVAGSKEDRLYRVMASVEGGYDESGWDMATLGNTLHWAVMLGFDAEVRDASGSVVMTAGEAYEGLSDPMKKKMDSVMHPHEPQGEFEAYPLYSAGKEIGSLMVRPLSIEMLRAKENMFKKRGRTFLIISFLIAGGGAVFLSAVFSFFLTAPLRRLRRAASAVAAGDLTVRVKGGAKDEVGELSESFDRMVESLEREEALRRRLTSNIAHELRTPLTVIKGNLDALSDGVIENDAGIKNITAETDRLINLVSGIEDMTRAEAGFMTPSTSETINVKEFLDGVVSGMRPLFEEKGLTVSLKEGIELTVKTETEKLERILKNILYNSLKFTQKGGVTVSFGGVAERFYIEVTDTGPGIPDDRIQDIFKRFYKGEGSNGVGLGLSIVKELVEVMGGGVEVTSKPGHGATFRVMLPVEGRGGIKG